MAGRLDGVGEGADDVLVGGEVLDVLQVLGERLAGHGDAFALDHAFLEEELEQGRGAANVVQVFEDVLAGRLEVGEEGCAVGDGLEVFYGQLDADAVRDGDQVEDGIGRAAGDVDKDHGLLEGLSGDNVARADVFLEQILDRLTGIKTLLHLCLGVGRI